MRIPRWLGPAFVAVMLGASGCGEGDVFDTNSADTTSARAFRAYPLYWVGERFEKWDLVHVDVAPTGFTTFIYGNCEIDDPDGFFGPEGGSCAPPLDIQIQPLCAHLAVVARAPLWKHRRIRSAPVGTIDSAPVMFTRGAQVKIYRGQGTDPGLPMRALRALRSINKVRPVIGRRGPIPSPAPGVLDGRRPCHSPPR
jgi:hypothetical protein